VLTDRGLHALSDLGLFERGQVKDIRVYQPHADFAEGDLTHPLVEGLRPNARQMVEAAILGYEIGDTASPMTGVDTTAWKAAKGVTVAETTRSDSDGGDTAPVTTVGELALGAGKIRIVGGALPTPTEENDHRYGLRDYGLTYSGLYIMENAIRYDAPGLGAAAPAGFSPVRPGTPAANAQRDAARRESLAATGADVTLATVASLLVLTAAYLRRRRRLASPITG
jgi:hypothetical protein